MTATMPPMATLAAAVRWHSDQTPDLPAVTDLRFRGTIRLETSLSYRELDHRADALAARLIAVTAPGDRVTVMCDHGVDYAVAFLGCLYAQRVAVPLFPADRPSRAARLHAVLRDAAPAASLLSPQDLATGTAMADRLGVLIRVDGGKPTAAADSRIDRMPDPDALAYLQYTSGSTRTPAGVMVTGRNIVAHFEQLLTVYPVVSERPMVNWLPLFHDMGLIFSLCLPLYAGTHAVTMAPTEFVKRPARWPQALSDYRAGATASPNFGLDMAVRDTSPDERSRLDLSTVRVLMNGSEPIRPASLRAFTAAFAASRFDPAAHSGAYGLAEATLVVTANAEGRGTTTIRADREALAQGRVVPVGRASGAAVEVVGCGTAVGQSVAIVDPETRQPCGERQVGEVWVAGPNVCSGYHGRPESTAEVFRAQRADHPSDWLRTGDLGFLMDADLFVVARLKDLIIIDGRNIYPADIEATVIESVPQFRPGHVVAFSIDRASGERVVIAGELDRNTPPSVRLPDLARRVRTIVANHYETMPVDVLFIEHGGLPKTTSGKLQRSATADRYRAGSLAVLPMDSDGRAIVPTVVR
ncbi:fatty acyl-AMP ligase [Nocardia sp. CDC159]|uniref:Fatty acyl-AMP ligase n=1 Tax=Nocardia pulmonis TaxID=2951408 RepID=A0A9X2EBX7_9NOCA|nr:MULTISPECIES: fatty acyl-AMP ligase [Nocardia]MCM6776373.1 fatty acyl-AMP ligase [Nocardia pulmonis]MCM6788797.1 fatty acyl-AMP ligase [Nocardia sp. CDC159]